MTNKARNIYIDTTGFCEEALRRVNRAIDALGGASHYLWREIKVIGIDEDGEIIARSSIRLMRDSIFMDHPRQVWLWELESLAGIR